MTAADMQKINRDRDLAAWRTIGAMEALSSQLDRAIEYKDMKDVHRIATAIHRCLWELDQVPKIDTSRIGDQSSQL